MSSIKPHPNVITSLLLKFNMAHQTGHDPVTYGLEDRYSLQLNYWCIKYGRASPNLPWTTNSITYVCPLAITLIKP